MPRLNFSGGRICPACDGKGVIDSPQGTRICPECSGYQLACGPPPSGDYRLYAEWLAKRLDTTDTGE